MKYIHSSQRRLNLSIKVSFLAVLTVATALSAGAANSVAPNAGSILKQIQPVNPPAPSYTGTGLIIEDADRGDSPATTSFLVKSIQLSGNTIFDTATLHALVADAEGKDSSLSQLSEVARRITNYYRGRGYPLTRAIIPAQSIQTGVLQIRIVEARYGKITLDNRSRVNDSILLSTLSSLQGGQAISQNEMNHTLLLLSDVPGIVNTATLKPGESVGTSDMVVDTAATPSPTGTVELDNYGNRYTGDQRLGGAVNFINPLNHGDILSLAGLTSGSDMNYGALTYESLLNGRGTWFGGSVSVLHYKLGNSLESLYSHGTAQVESLWMKQPLVRGQNSNLYGQIQYERKQLDDHIDAAWVRTDRHLDTGSVSLSGDLRNAILSNSVNSWSIAWIFGQVGFDDTNAQLADSMTAKSRGSFSIWAVNFSHLQTLSPTDALYFGLSGQRTNRNLDAAEKLVAGGPYTVRAYATGVISGDTGILATGEFRHTLARVLNGQLQAITFIDSERVTVNHTTWVAGPNAATLNGAGAGVNWANDKNWHAKITAAVAFGAASNLAGANKSAQAWVEIGKGF